MNKRIGFCHQLAAWLHGEDWHFTTLLAVCIETIDELPLDIDELVNDVLLAFPRKPANAALVDYLRQSPRVHAWFQFSLYPPRITQYSLSAEANPPLLDDRLPVIDSVGDLARWLELDPGQLDWLADLKRQDPKTPAYLQHYHYQLVPKRDGSKRLIESPKSLLKSVQRRINREILVRVAVHDAAHGFIPGRSCRSHAALHTNKACLIQFDLAHCFHSIHWGQVSSVFRGLGYSAAVSKYLTALCTHRGYAAHPALSELDAQQRRLLRDRHLPQGAPSSPALSNAVLFRLDKRLHGLANSLGLDYSRYADDLALSGNRRRDWRFLEPLVGSICLEQGFAINYRKTRMVKAHQRQKLTGIVVNQKTNIDRRDFDRLKAILTNCARHGLESQNRNGHPEFRAYLWGSIQYVKSLNPVRGGKLEEIYSRISRD